MFNLIARLYRSLPLVIALVALAVVIYLIVSWRRSPNRAKEILIRVFIILCSALCAFFLLACLYAASESNVPVLELAEASLMVSAVGLVITLVCRAIFLRNHPHYRRKISHKAKMSKGNK